MDEEKHELVRKTNGVGSKLQLTVDEVVEEYVGSFGFSQLVQVTLVSLARIFDSHCTLVTIFTDAQPQSWRCIGHECGSAGGRTAASVCGLKPGTWEWSGGNTSSTIAAYFSLLPWFPYRLCGLRPPRGWTLRAEKSSACFMSPNCCYHFPNFLLSKHIDLLSSPFCKWIFTSRHRDMLPGAFDRNHWPEMARSSWPIWIFLLCSRFLSIPLLAYPTRTCWRNLYRIISILPLLYSIFILMPFVAESPRWLLVRGRSEEALAVAVPSSVYLKHDEFHKAEGLYSEIPEGMRSIVADSAMVDAYAKAGRINKAKEVFDKMPERNVFSWTSLISGYFRLGRVDDAVELFWRMPDSEKNVITWSNMIMGFARNGLVDEARVAFDRMPLKNVVAWTSMIKAYVENDRVDEAFSLFRVMPDYSSYAWNIMISGLLNENRVDEANELFDSMPWRNAISWTIMVTGLARNGMTELARKYFDQMLNKDVPAWNAMISAYADEGRMVEAGELFNMMSKRNIITWNTMIGGYSKGRHEDEAFRLFGLMLQGGIRPNETSLISLMTSCGGILGVLQAHGLIVRLGFEMLTPVANALITMYHRSGDVISAQIAFKNLDEKDVVTWTAIIIAYSNHGFGTQALQAFALMLRFGHNPDEITFVGVLSACSHAGFVKKGRMLFDSIKRGYGLEPTPEHYSCLVDILGRGGLVNEAVKVVDEMPPDKCDSAVLGALIGACRLIVGADELIELEPASSGGYVLLANLYAASGKWDKFSQLRKKMKDREVRKVPGFSQIEVNGKSHVFLVGDRAHPEMKEIYQLLLIPEMKDFGYEIANFTCIVF